MILRHEQSFWNKLVLKTSSEKNNFLNEEHVFFCSTDLRFFFQFRMLKNDLRILKNAKLT